MIPATRLVVAETSASTYATITGLIVNRGFVMLSGYPCGLYPKAMAERIIGDLDALGIAYHATPADNYNEGRAKLRHLLEVAA